jgi:hypothetical protein
MRLFDVLHASVGPLSISKPRSGCDVQRLFDMTVACRRGSLRAPSRSATGCSNARARLNDPLNCRLAATDAGYWQHRGNNQPGLALARRNALSANPPPLARKSNPRPRLCHGEGIGAARLDAHGRDSPLSRARSLSRLCAIATLDRSYAAAALLESSAGRAGRENASPSSSTTPAWKYHQPSS